MNDVTLDIETIPAQESRILDWLRDRALLETKEDESVDDAFDRLWRATSLDGAYGEIISIGAAIDARPVKTWKRRLGEPEGEMLAEFFADFAKVPRPCVVGHNVVGFDRPMLRKRALVRRVKAPLFFTKDLKPWDTDVYDTLLQWQADRRDWIKLGNLMFALGLADTPVKGEVDGGDVWSLVQQGRYDVVDKYQRADVDDTRACAWVMMGRPVVFTERGQQ